MPLFGSSDRQKEAERQLSQIPAEILEQARKGWTREGEMWAQANGLQTDFITKLVQQYDEGIGTPEDTRATGARVMPGVDDLITRRQNRIGGQIADFDALPGAQATIDRRGAIQAGKDAGIGAHYEDIQGAINTGFGSQRTRTGDTADALARDTDLTYADAAGRTSNAITDQIKYTGAGFDAIGDAADTAYSDARAKAGTGFGSIKRTASGQITDARDKADAGFDAIDERSGETYDQVRSRINQGRDFDTGTTARAFAPAMAATLRRLRNAGIDPNAPEAAALMAKVDSARGHAFDDTATRALENLNSADLAELANRQGLDLSRMSNDQILALRDSANQQDLDLAGMSNDQTLGLRQAENRQTLDISKLSNTQKLFLENTANKQGLSLQAYLQRVEQSGKTRDLLNSLDAGNMEANIGNAEATFARSQNADTQRMQNELINQGMRLDEFGNRVTLSDKANENDMTALGLQNTQYNAGAAHVDRDLRRRDQATTEIGNTALAQFGITAQQGSQASQNASRAQQGYTEVYDREAPNSNVFSKFVGGLANTAVGAAVGGLTGGFGIPKKKRP